MTEVLLSSGAEGNQSKTSSYAVNGFFKGCLHLQALPNIQIIKSAYKEKDGCALQVNRDKYISGAAGKRRWGEKGAVGRESAREQFRLNT